MKKHLKRLAAPRPWAIPRKSSKWAARPRPGPHPLDRSIPLLYIVRDMLEYADTAREAKRMISAKEVLVDGRPVTDLKFPVGLMDVLTIPKLKENYRILLDPKGKFRPMSIDAKRAKWKLVRIENKTTIKGGKIQLNLHDGRNIILDENAYRTGDTLKINVPSQKIVTSYPLDKGNVAMLIGGKHAGAIAHVEHYEPTRNPREDIVTFKEGFATIKKNVFIVGKKKPEIVVPESRAV